MNGLLLLDKPAGLTSHDAVFRLRKQTGTQKIGHAGTLDPFATGLLLLLFGQATRLSQFFTGLDKEYRVRLRLGQESDTFDLTGTVVREQPVDVSHQSFVQVLEGLRGDIEQVPPMYSAVKIRGQRLYKLARKGQVVERMARTVSIRALEMLTTEQDWIAASPSVEPEITVRCSSGTYIRSLVQDLGAKLGCGALVAELHRTAAGPYVVQDAMKLDNANPDTVRARLIPMECLLQEMPGATISESELQRISHGQQISARPSMNPGWVRLLDGEKKLVGLGKVDAGGIQPRIVLV